MDLHLGQGIHTLRSFDLFLFTSHFEAHWGRAWLFYATCTLTLHQQWQGGLHRRVALPSLFLWLSQEGSGQGWEADSDKLCHWHSCHTSFQFLVPPKWLWSRMNSQNCCSKAWSENFAVTESCLSLPFRHHTIPSPELAVVWKNYMPNNTSAVMKVPSSVHCLVKPSTLLLRRNSEPSFGED